MFTQTHKYAYAPQQHTLPMLFVCFCSSSSKCIYIYIYIYIYTHTHTHIDVHINTHICARTLTAQAPHAFRVLLLLFFREMSFQPLPQELRHDVCVYVFMYVCMLCCYSYEKWVFSSFPRDCDMMCVCVCVCMYVCMYASALVISEKWFFSSFPRDCEIIRMYVCMHACIYVCMYVEIICMYVLCMHVCMSRHANIYTHTHIYIYIYIYIYYITHSLT